MKYPSQVGATNNAHVVVARFPTDLTGTARAKVWKLLAGNVAPSSITLSAANDQLVAIPGVPRMFVFDLHAAMEAESSGSFAATFPRWTENAALFEFYDDAEPENIDVAKITFGGGEDQIDEITGPDHRNLTEIYDALLNRAVWTVRTGYNYVDTGSQVTDTISFTPFLQRGNQAVTDRFLRSASVSVYNINGSTPLYTAQDDALTTTLSSAVAPGDAVWSVASTAGLAPTEILAIGGELVTIVSVDSGTQLTVTRASAGTSAESHGIGAEAWRSAADTQGVFLCSKIDTSALTYGQSYTLLATITHAGVSYTSSHTFQFVQNDV